MKRTVLALMVVMAIFLGSKAESQTCSCRELLDTLTNKIETDYAGYIHKVVEAGKLPAYNNFKKELQLEAAKHSYSDCYSVLNSFTEYFKDGHVFIVEFPPTTPQQSDSLKAFIKHFDLPANYESTLVTVRSRDAIEGIWKDALGQQIAIIKVKDNVFYGVTQQTSVAGWQPGMVRFELEKTPDGAYNVTYYKNGFAKIHFAGEHIYKNTLFSFGVYKLAKMLPHNPEVDYVNLNNPEMPVMKIIDKNNLLLTVPSALVENKDLDSVLNLYDSVLKVTPNLIIDMRGDGGGNYIWGRLLYIANTIVHPVDKRDGDDFLMLASQDDADYIRDRMQAYYKSVKNTAAVAFYDDLINKIKSNLGKIVSFSYYSSGPDTATRMVMPYPKQVSIITDRGVASAAEAFILGARETGTKVVLYGDNTWGMIDYMNVNTLPLPCGNNKTFYFGYPVYFAKDIKTNPHNATGIKPDIYIPANVTDWVKWVANDYNKK